MILKCQASKCYDRVSPFVTCKKQNTVSAGNEMNNNNFIILFWNKSCYSRSINNFKSRISFSMILLSKLQATRSPHSLSPDYYYSCTPCVCSYNKLLVTKLSRHCTQTGYLQRTKESAPLPCPLHSKLGCLLSCIGSLNISTALHGGDGGGKAIFPPFEVSKM